MMKPTYRALLILLICLLPIGKAAAQSGIRLVSSEASYLYDDHLSISAQFESQSRLIEGQAFIASDAGGPAEMIELELDSSQRVEIQLRIEGADRFPAFSHIQYWFLLTNADGDLFESEKQSIYYEDNRHDWQTLSQGAYSVRWYAGEAEFGAAILAAAQHGAERLAALLPLEPPSQLDFMVYPTADQLRDVLDLAGYDWIAGHTDPDLGWVMLAIGPDAAQSLEIERQVPHEVAHHMLIENLGAERAAALPLWLSEGLASNTEAYSDPDRQQLLQLNHAAGTLIPLSQLCRAFPQDGDRARLAYAQAADFLAYLHETAGDAGFRALFENYVSNPDCENGSQSVFAQSLSELDAAWQQARFVPHTVTLEDHVAALPWDAIGYSALFAFLIFVFFGGLGGRGKEPR